MKVELLQWDTDFFGYRIGKCTINQHENISDFHALISSYQLVYLFTDDELSFVIDNMYFVDKKVTLTQNLDNLNISENSKVVNCKNVLTDDLLKLAIESGEYSRFRIDKNFKNSEYERLYSRWIINSLNDANVYVYLTIDQLKISGLITVRVKGFLAEIGLVSVDKNYRGKGIGSSLVNHAIYKAKKMGALKINVITQGKNLPALKLYEKCGFKTTDIKYVYHYWNATDL